METLFYVHRGVNLIVNIGGSVYSQPDLKYIETFARLEILPPWVVNIVPIRLFMINAPNAGTSSSDKQKDKTVKRSQFAVIDDWKERV